MTRRKFASVWDAIEPTQESAAHMKLRARLMADLQRRIRDEGWTQSESAKRLRVTQPRVSALMRGKIADFSIDTLIEMLAALGAKVELRVRAA